MKKLDTASLDLIFRDARTHAHWQDQPVTDETLRELYDLVKMGPTSVNSGPARIIFVRSAEAKARLLPALAPGNLEKTRTAPVTAIVAYDTEFYEKLPKLFPHADARSWFVGNQAMIDSTATQNTAIQSGYLILAARALGLDVGPMAGFDAAKVNAEFFPDGKLKATLLVNLGYGDESKLYPRGPRLSFEEAAKLV